MWSQNNEDNYFANMDYSKSVANIMPSIEIMVNLCADMTRSKKAYFLYAEKIDFKELIQIRLAEKCDQRKMFITTIDSASFQELKQDQSLNVTFAGFMENLIRMLKDCQTGKLELCITARDGLISTPQNNSNNDTHDYHLQFVEIRSFKNLVHLCLPCRSAPLNTVLFYINATLETAHKRTYLVEQSLQQLQLELSSQKEHSAKVETENRKLREALIDNTRQLNEQHSLELQQMQDKLAKMNEQRSSELDRNRRTISGIQAQLDKAMQEKSEQIAQNEQIEKRLQTINEELACCKSRVITLKEQNEKLHVDLSNGKRQERKLEHKIEDINQQSAELQDQLLKSNKEKANIAAELEAEKKILNTKRQALAIASEEIAKANQIILKQSQELVSLKKTIAWRTEIALQQEKAINEKEKLLSLREEELRHTRNSLQQMRDEIPQQLNSMRQFAEGLEQKYSKQVHAIKQRLSGSHDKENHGQKALQARRK